MGFNFGDNYFNRTGSTGHKEETHYIADLCDLFLGRRVSKRLQREGAFTFSKIVKLHEVMFNRELNRKNRTSLNKDKFRFLGLVCTLMPCMLSEPPPLVCT